MSFFLKRKKYSNVENNSSIKNTLKIYILGLFDFVNSKNLRIINYVPEFIKKIVDDIDKSYNLEIINFTGKYYQYKKDANLNEFDYDNSNNLLYNNISKFIDLERVNIRIVLEDFDSNIIKKIEKKNNIVYDLNNTFILQNNKYYFKQFKNGSNIKKIYFKNLNIVQPNLDFLLKHKINIHNLKLFDIKNKKIITYLNVLDKFKNLKNKNIYQIIEIYADKWKELINDFWKENKRILKLNNFGEVSNINWQKNVIESIFNLIWINSMTNQQINQFINNNLKSLITL